MSEDKRNIDKKIDEIHEILGDEDHEKTIFEIVDSDDKKLLTLRSGSWNSSEPWFGVDEDQNLHTMVSIKSLAKFIESYRDLARENFDLRLERSIAQHFPIDFGDVWTVCMDEIRKIALENPQSTTLNIDLNEIVGKVKQEYPNLFIDLERARRGNL